MPNSVDWASVEIDPRKVYWLSGYHDDIVGQGECIGQGGCIEGKVLYLNRHHSHFQLMRAELCFLVSFGVSDITGQPETAIVFTEETKTEVFRDEKGELKYRTGNFLRAVVVAIDAHRHAA